MFAYPIEVATDLYVSKVGGFSPELEKNEIGINIDAIYSNTSIIANETYAKIRFLGERAKPFFFRESYRVIGLEPNMEGFEYSQNGEVVFSESLANSLGTYIGKDVIINTVETFRLNIDIITLVKKCLESQRGEKRRL
ncbi:hypothetical protein [Archaeoglobus profundus]|uniref:Uncharacterized protein n=1 Tax=Archaeoglobus profundus (strain DSM 5631 / JCM 9629 / NBRC 100127 / Av18) TaxID=572546 RepID=D2RH53_ARCPA|nr:hypothetical protein [Archaeoglobus profundus]ADB57628.1 hypothetical protein Arcpr_0563 [Archaeoglobus profundus DSM 5631]